MVPFPIPNDPLAKKTKQEISCHGHAAYRKDIAIPNHSGRHPHASQIIDKIHTQSSKRRPNSCIVIFRKGIRKL